MYEGVWQALARWVRMAALAIVVIAVTTGMLGPGSSAQEYDVRERQLGERVLSMGSWGADVFALQMHLRDLGFELQADGLFGPKARDAVGVFQERNGIRVTGSVGPETLEALNDALLRRMATMTYTVRPGDSLWSIAREFQTTMEVIIAINDLPDRPLRAGERIKVPALLVHVVKAGDTLWDIAKRYHSTVEEIAALNNLDPGAVLRIGTELKLPRNAFQVP